MPLPLRSRGWLIAATGFIVASLLAAPSLRAAGRVEAAAFYAVFAAFCHQLPPRSWVWLGEPLPVCVRCFGVYLGAFAAFGVALRFTWLRLGVALITGVVSVLLDVLGTGAPWARFISGLLLGAAGAASLLLAVTASPRAHKGWPLSDNRS